MTRGFWAIVKNGKTKMIYSNSDSYPESLGKDVVFAIQNGLDRIQTSFDRIIFVKNINNLDRSEFRYILTNPLKLFKNSLEDKYFAENAEEDFEEYGYMINLDEEVLVLFKGKKEIGKLKFDKINYFDMVKIFDDEMDAD